MLMQLSIHNFAVIENISVTFEKGFNVLTGETGAGKSIIIDALGMLVGGRASADYIRHGKEKAELEALFDVNSTHPVYEVLQRYGIAMPDEEMLIVRRELYQQGKSIARVNGQLVNVSMLKAIGDTLVDIHGQHDHQSLLHSNTHMDWLDASGGAQLTELRSRVATLYKQYSDIRQQLSELRDNEQQWLRNKDLYAFQLEEIEKAHLKRDEEERLFAELQKLSNSSKISAHMAEAYEMLYGDREALEKMAVAIDRLEAITKYDQRFGQLLESLQSAYYQAEDAAAELRDLKDELLDDPSRIQAVEERIDLIQTLKRKYGSTIAEILHYAETINQELLRMENKDEELERLTKQQAHLEKELSAAAAELSEKRMKAADRLAQGIEQQLHHLQMDRARFAVSVTSIQDPLGILTPKGTPLKISADGFDHVEFLFSANPGEPLKPISKIASGGELSRVMLAMKTVLADADPVRTLIFDEVDTGVSGRAAQSIAEKLAGLADRFQVFSITHLPQVACMADHHYRIEKTTEDASAKTEVRQLTHDDRVKELARMLGGVEVTAVTKQHALEMLQMAVSKKQDMQSRLHLA